jgi:hypothetical protein
MTLPLRSRLPGVTSCDRGNRRGSTGHLMRLAGMATAWKLGGGEAEQYHDALVPHGRVTLADGMGPDSPCQHTLVASGSDGLNWA